MDLRCPTLGHSFQFKHRNNSKIDFSKQIPRDEIKKLSQRYAEQILCLESCQSLIINDLAIFKIDSPPVCEYRDDYRKDSILSRAKDEGKNVRKREKE